MKAACPQCHGATVFSDAGGLFQIRCTSCDWSQEGTVSYVWPEMSMAERMPVMAAKVAAPVTAAVLKSMRNIFIEARQLPLNELAARLSSDSGLLVGTLQAYRLSEVTGRLAPAGVQLVRVPHEEDDH